MNAQSRPVRDLVAPGPQALAYVVIRPGSKPGAISVEASHRGLTGPQAAYVLKSIAAQWSIGMPMQGNTDT